MRFNRGGDHRREESREREIAQIGHELVKYDSQGEGVSDIVRSDIGGIVTEHHDRYATFLGVERSIASNI